MEIGDVLYCEDRDWTWTILDYTNNGYKVLTIDPNGCTKKERTGKVQYFSSSDLQIKGSIVYWFGNKFSFFRQKEFIES